MSGTYEREHQGKIITIIERAPKPGERGWYVDRNKPLSVAMDDVIEMSNTNEGYGWPVEEGEDYETFNNRYPTPLDLVYTVESRIAPAPVDVPSVTTYIPPIHLDGNPGLLVTVLARGPEADEFGWHAQDDRSIEEVLNDVLDCRVRFMDLNQRHGFGWPARFRRVFENPGGFRTYTVVVQEEAPEDEVAPREAHTGNPKTLTTKTLTAGDLKAFLKNVADDAEIVLEVSTSVAECEVAELMPDGYVALRGGM